MFIPVSEINKLRREAIEKLEGAEASTVKEFRNEFVSIKPHQGGKKRLICRFSDIETIPENWDYIEQVIVPLGEEKKVKKSVRVSVEVPRGIFGSYEKILRQLNAQVFATFGESSAWLRRAGVHARTSLRISLAIPKLMVQSFISSTQ